MEPHLGTFPGRGRGLKPEGREGPPERIGGGSPPQALRLGLEGPASGPWEQTPGSSPWAQGPCQSQVPGPGRLIRDAIRAPQNPAPEAPATCSVPGT